MGVSRQQQCPHSPKAHVLRDRDCADLQMPCTLGSLAPAGHWLRGDLPEPLGRLRAQEAPGGEPEQPRDAFFSSQIRALPLKPQFRGWRLFLAKVCAKEYKIQKIQGVFQGKAAQMSEKLGAWSAARAGPEQWAVLSNHLPGWVASQQEPEPGRKPRESPRGQVWPQT